MKAFMLLLVVAQLVTPAQGSSITASWDGQVLIVDATPGSLYLVGGFRDDTYVGAGHVELKAYGVDVNRTPIGRDAIELRDSNGIVVASLPVPPLPQAPGDRRRVLLPSVVRPATPVYLRYFPLMAKQQNP